MRNNPLWFCALLAVYPVTSSGFSPIIAESNSGQRVTIHHVARSIQPGEIVRLIVESERPLMKVQAEFEGQAFVGYPTKISRRWDILVGLDLMVQPSARKLSVEGAYKDGSIFKTFYELDIKGKQFPTRRLTVAAKFVNPPKGALKKIREDSQRTGRIFESVTPTRFWSGPFKSPVPGATTSGFGKRSILNGVSRSPHSGADFRATTGTPIKSPNSGKVALVGYLYYSGNTVILDHGHGMISYFAHLSKTHVKVGQVVYTGQVLGEVGATGRVTGPHLHWSVRLMRTRVDPLALIEILREE
jgi:murein DD-endopeptidase MepM/ murein hydrolase activator NlpD